MPLHQAAFSGNLAVVKLLVERGADLSAGCKVRTNERGRTPAAFNFTIATLTSAALPTAGFTSDLARVDSETPHDLPRARTHRTRTHRYTTRLRKDTAASSVSSRPRARTCA
jgi:hypothetical protein